MLASYLFHKTTNRKVYDNILKEYENFDDVLLLNEKGELTESCYGNIVIEKKGVFYTPPVSCGLLAGTMRSFFIDEKKIMEKILCPEDLFNCDNVFLINSVRGFIYTEFIKRP